MGLNAINLSGHDQVHIPNLGDEICRTIRLAIKSLTAVDEDDDGYSSRVYLSNKWFGKYEEKKWFPLMLGKLSRMATIISTEEINVYGKIPSEDKPLKKYPENVKFNIELDDDWETLPTYTFLSNNSDYDKSSKFHTLVCKLSQIIIDTRDIRKGCVTCRGSVGCGKNGGRVNADNWGFFLEDYRMF